MATTHLCHFSGNMAIDNMHINGCSCVKIELFIRTGSPPADFGLPHPVLESSLKGIHIDREVFHSAVFHAQKLP